MVPGVADDANRRDSRDTHLQEAVYREQAEPVFDADDDLHCFRRPLPSFFSDRETARFRAASVFIFPGSLCDRRRLRDLGSEREGLVR